MRLRPTKLRLFEKRMSRPSVVVYAIILSKNWFARLQIAAFGIINNATCCQVPAAKESPAAQQEPEATTQTEKSPHVEIELEDVYMAIQR